MGEAAAGRFIDDRSRFLCHAQWYTSESTEQLVHGFCQALQKVGLPRSLMSDRGSAMMSGEFTAGLHRLGILHVPTLPRSPHVNGKQENLWSRVEAAPVGDAQKRGEFLARCVELRHAGVDHSVVWRSWFCGYKAEQRRQKAFSYSNATELVTRRLAWIWSRLRNTEGTIMVEQIFERARAIRRHSAAPLFAERQQFLESLRIRGASKNLLKHYATYLLPVIEALCREWPVTVTEEQIQRAADRWEQRRHRSSFEGKLTGRRNFVLVARAWFRFFDRLQLPRIPYADKVEEFVEYLRSERNLAFDTIRTLRFFVQRLLLWIDSKKLTLRKADASAIDLFLADQVRHGDLQRASIHNYAHHMRSFLNYAEHQGWCKKGTAASIDPPRVYKAAMPPSGPSWAEVMRLLRGLRGSDPKLIRDRAIILLFAIYGFRASEVRKLSLDDIDWKGHRIHLRRSKESCSTQEYPLVDSVRDALVSYLKCARPRSTRREVFLTLCVPYRPLCNSAFWQIVRKRLKPISPELRHHGPHALRHACATRLLRQQVDIKSIGDLLGHRNPASTSIYAKVDLVNLRRVADIDLGRFI